MVWPLGARNGWKVNKAAATLDIVYDDVAVAAVSAAGVNVTGVLNSTGAFRSASATTANGYATGAGGAVTQDTSAATGVALSKPTGVITTVALTTVAGAEEQFIVTNTLVAATDIISLSTTYGGAGTPLLSVRAVGANVFTITISNAHAANAFNAVMVINFAIIKGVNA